MDTSGHEDQDDGMAIGGNNNEVCKNRGIIKYKNL